MNKINMIVVNEKEYEVDVLEMDDEYNLIRIIDTVPIVRMNMCGISSKMYKIDFHNKGDRTYLRHYETLAEAKGFFQDLYE